MTWLTRWSQRARRWHPLEQPTHEALIADTVACELVMEVVEVVPVSAQAPRSVPVVLRYDVTDPFAVCAEFHVEPGPGIRWVFARSLLSDGLVAPSGDGDVRIAPTRGRGGRGLEIRLTSPEGEARVVAAAPDVVGFLRRTYDVCPPGAERDHLDFDGVLRMLLAS